MKSWPMGLIMFVVEVCWLTEHPGWAKRLNLELLPWIEGRFGWKPEWCFGVEKEFRLSRLAKGGPTGARFLEAGARVIDFDSML